MQIEGMVTASKPATIHDTIRMAHKLMAQVIRRGTSTTENYQGKWNGNSNTSSNPISQPEPLRFYATEPKGKQGYAGNKTFCHGRKRHHEGTCGIPCERCQRIGHKIWGCRILRIPTHNEHASNAANPVITKKDCPKSKGKVYLIETKQSPN